MQIRITDLAEEDAHTNYEWWAKHRSAEQAVRWLQGIYAAMFELATTANQHPYATEAELKLRKIRQASFGLGKRPSHRILYAVRDDLIVIYRIQAFKQNSLGVDDLFG